MSKVKHSVSPSKARTQSTSGEPALSLETFEEVIDFFESPLLRYVGRFLGANSIDTEDVVQETFIKLHQLVCEKGAESITSLKAWLFRVAHNHAMDIGRKRQRNHQHRQRVQEESDETDALEKDMLENMVRREAGLVAMRELKNLHEEEQQVILLKTLQDLKLREISEVTGLSIGKVAYRLNQGLAALASRLKEGGLL